MKRVAVLALLVLLPACGGDVFGPQDIAGGYSLRSTPAILQTGAVQVEILADTLFFDAEGNAFRRVREIVHAELELYLERTETYRYRVRRGFVELALVCPPDALALCTPPPHIWGVRTRDGLVLRHAQDTRVRMDYEPVPSNLRIH